MNTQTLAFAPNRSLSAFDDVAAFDHAAAFDDVAVSPAVLAMVLAALVGGIGAVALAAVGGFGIWGLVGAYMAGNLGVGSLAVGYLSLR